MDEAIYRMSLAESILVLLVIALWLFAIVNLARKLERLCNPPSIFPNYSLKTKTNFDPLARPTRVCTNASSQSLSVTVHHLMRATSEPTVDPSSRAVVAATYVRSPSETCLAAKLTISPHRSSPSTFELGERAFLADHSLFYSSHYRHHSVQTRKSANATRPSGNFLYPRRLPSIVRRSLLDLHRRAAFHPHPSNLSNARSFDKETSTFLKEPRSAMSTTNIPFAKKFYQRANAVDEDDSLRGKQRGVRRTVSNACVAFRSQVPRVTASASFLAVDLF